MASPDSPSSSLDVLHQQIGAVRKQLELLRDRERPIPPMGVQVADREATHAALTLLLSAVEKIAETQLLFTTLEVQKLKLEPGEVLVLKLGDRKMGWIPAPDQEVHIGKIFNQALDSIGADNPVVVYHYGLEISTIKAKVAEAMRDAAAKKV